MEARSMGLRSGLVVAFLLSMAGAAHAQDQPKLPSTAHPPLPPGKAKKKDKPRPAEETPPSAPAEKPADDTGGPPAPPPPAEPSPPSPSPAPAALDTVF